MYWCCLVTRQTLRPRPDEDKPRPNTKILYQTRVLNQVPERRFMLFLPFLHLLYLLHKFLKAITSLHQRFLYCELSVDLKMDLTAEFSPPLVLEREPRALITRQETLKN